MKNFTAGIILLLAGSGWATPQIKLNLGGLFGRTNNNQENRNTNNPLQAALEEILANTDVRIGSDGVKVELNQVSACPPLLGDPAPLGCDKTFADDEGIPCWDDTDCPCSDTCENNICKLDYLDCGTPVDPGCFELWGEYYDCKRDDPDCDRNAPDCETPESCYSGGQTPSYTSPISGQSIQTNTCSFCSETTCPSAKPCKRGGNCYRPRCNRRGRCWCRK